MSRVLIASCWMLIPLGLCSCVDDTDVRPSPAPVVESTPPVTIVEPEPEPKAIQQDLADSVDDLNEDVAAEETDPAPSSGNPLINFFRSVDRGVKSTTENSNKPEPVDGNKPADQ